MSKRPSVINVTSQTEKRKVNIKVIKILKAPLSLALPTFIVWGCGPGLRLS